MVCIFLLTILVYLFLSYLNDSKALNFLITIKVLSIEKTFEDIKTVIHLKVKYPIN